MADGSAPHAHGRARETRGIDLSLSLERLRAAAADAPAGTVALCDTSLHCFGRDREDDIAMLALRLRLG